MVTFLRFVLIFKIFSDFSFVSFVGDVFDRSLSIFRTSVVERLVSRQLTFAEDELNARQLETLNLHLMNVITNFVSQIHFRQWRDLRMRMSFVKLCSLFSGDILTYDVIF